MTLKISAIVVLLSLAACRTGGDGTDTEAVAAKSAAEEAQPAASPGKPSAPISIRYQVLGTPIVGQPVPVELEITSSVTDRPIKVSYHINDPASMMFPESQAREVGVSIPAAEGRTTRQVTVVPQRDGRLYLNVLAEVETDAGTMIKSIAIPVSASRGAEETETNGELKETADGETVVSMPAEEN